MNPYDVLGVEKDASDEEVKDAYREKAKEHHPDQGGDEEKFKEVQKAYEEITSEGGFDGKRRGFNRRRGEKSVEDFIRDFERWATEGGFSEPGFKGDPFGSSGEQPTVREVILDFHTAVLGKNVEVPFNGEMKTIDVPPGVESGEIFNYFGMVVKFKVENNSSFWRKNKNDIYTKRKVSIFDAMTGKDDIEIETVQGKGILLSIGPGTQPGETFRLPGWGGPKTHQGKPKGDMYVEVDIDVPAVTEEGRVELINKLHQ